MTNSSSILTLLIILKRFIPFIAVYFLVESKTGKTGFLELIQYLNEIKHDEITDCFQYRKTKHDFRHVFVF